MPTSVGKNGRFHFQIIVFVLDQMGSSSVATWWLATSLINLCAAGTIASPSAYLTLHCDNRGALYTSNDNGATWELSGTAEHWPTPFVAEILDIVPETVIRWECMLNFAVSFSVDVSLCLYYLRGIFNLFRAFHLFFVLRKNQNESVFKPLD